MIPRSRASSLLSLLLLLQGPNPATAAESVVARVGSREVPASEIRAYLDDLPATERAALIGRKAELAGFVRSVLVRQALLQDALAAGWDRRPEVVTGLARLREQYIVENYLQNAAKVPDDYPSTRQVEEAYEAEKDRLKLPRRVLLSQIYLDAAGGQEAAKAEAEDLAARVRTKPADFGRLAKEHSDEATSAAREGRIGWVPMESLAPEIRQAVDKLDKGRISGPIPSGTGYHLIRLEDLREAGPASLEEAREDLKAALRLQRAKLNRDSYLATLLDRQPISVNELALDALTSEPSR